MGVGRMASLGQNSYLDLKKENSTSNVPSLVRCISTIPVPLGKALPSRRRASKEQIGPRRNRRMSPRGKLQQMNFTMYTVLPESTNQSAGQIVNTATSDKQRKHNSSVSLSDALQNL